MLHELRNTFIIQLFYKTACLIEELHVNNIVHGDIKPDNFLIAEHDKFNIQHTVYNKSFDVYLIDYGLSGIENKAEGTGGTTPYCHPEFRNTRDYKDTDNYLWGKIRKKHDVWSLGLSFITLYKYGKFNSFYYSFPQYFFDKNGYVTDHIFDTIANFEIRRLFRDILSPVSIPIYEVKLRLHAFINDNPS
jgi:serine/threonine protein kinase